MKNREKFREQILECAVVPGRDICDFKRKEVLPHFGKGGCACISCPWCSIMLNLWLDEEYEEPEEPEEPEVDWEDVPVDTLVWVRYDKSDNWILRYFSAYELGAVAPYVTWANGSTSITSGGIEEHWKYCELVEDEDDGSN